MRVIVSTSNGSQFSWASFFLLPLKIPQQGGSLWSAITHVAPAHDAQWSSASQGGERWTGTNMGPFVSLQTDLIAAEDVEISEWHSSTVWTTDSAPMFHHSRSVEGYKHKGEHWKDLLCKILWISLQKDIFQRVCTAKNRRIDVCRCPF